ncbi:MAG: glycosyltransferase [Acetobacteraceae bacterium]|nr:glycosyltransferase [Acetobacteraceae bacterium]
MSISLSMIVKDEARVVARCLASVRPLIAHWSIVDTGSTDGTRDVIRNVLGDLPGTLHERPWRDFASNRNEALELARPHGDYVLTIDADDTLEYAPGFRMPRLTHDSYELRILDASVLYARTHVVRSALPWRWRGVLHEFIACEAPQQGGGTIPGVWMRRNHDGARRRSACTYQRDAAVLEAALRAETDPFMRSRYTFYLAQSYRDSGQREKSVETYLARAELGFWNEEVFVSLLSAGRLMRDLGRPFEATRAVLERACAVCPWRAEALYAAAQLCTANARHPESYEFAKRGLGLSLPAGGLFVEPWIYEWGLLDAFAVSAYWARRYTDSMDAGLRLLSEGRLPESERGRVVANLRFAFEKLPRA